MKKEIQNLEFKDYYLREFQLFDGEAYVTFNIVSIDVAKEEIIVAVSNRGKVSVSTYDLFENKNGYYFEYGIYFEKINILDFEEVK